MVGKGKTRIQVSVNADVLQRVRSYLKELGLPRNEISVFLNMGLEGIEGQLAAMVAARRTGKQLTLGDVLGVMARTMEKAARSET